MPLPWVRMDTNLPSHDKILDLLSRYPRDAGRATAFVYVCSWAYIGHNGTDGLIPFAALGFIHGTRKDADRLVEVQLWRPAQRGWDVPNWLARQEAAAVTEAKNEAASTAARKAACSRWHEPGCMCWRKEA